MDVGRLSAQVRAVLMSHVMSVISCQKIVSSVKKGVCVCSAQPLTPCTHHCSGYTKGVQHLLYV